MYPTILSFTYTPHTKQCIHVALYPPGAPVPCPVPLGDTGGAISNHDMQGWGWSGLGLSLSLEVGEVESIGLYSLAGRTTVITVVSQGFRGTAE